MKKWARWPVLAAAGLGAAALGAGAAQADEHYSGQTMIGPRFGLVQTGQIDDPLEDVLEHAAILGSETTTTDGAAEAPDTAADADAPDGAADGTDTPEGAAEAP